MHIKYITYRKHIKRITHGGRGRLQGRLTYVTIGIQTQAKLTPWFQLFDRRLNTAEAHPDLQKHIPFLRRLGVSGMSSDGSDSEDEFRRARRVRSENPRYIILLPRWRASGLSTWLHMFDSVHIIMRRSGWGDLRGAWPHLRESNPTAPRYSDNTKFVSQLPRVLYDENWLRIRNDVDVCVKPTDEPFSCTHDDAILA